MRSINVEHLPVSSPPALWLNPPLQATQHKPHGAWLFLALLLLLSVVPLHAQPAANNPPRASRIEPSSNRVLELDGTGGYVELPPNIFNDLDEATVEAWVRWDDFSGTGKRLFNYGDALRDMSLYSGYGSTRLNFVVAGPAGTPADLRYVDADGFLRPQQWVHLAGVSGKGGMKLYLDGALVGTNAYTGSFSAFKNGTRNYLGQSVTTNEAPNNFKGAMDEVRVWRVARSAEQIRQTMRQRLTGREEGLAALWNFDNVVDGVVNDSGPGGHHGKLIGSAKAVVGETPASLARAKVSKVLELDGKHSYVEFPAGAFTNLDEVTVEGWIKWESFENMSRFFDVTLAGYSLDVMNRETDSNLVSEMYRGDNRTPMSVPGILSLGRWTHIAATAGKHGQKLFVDGAAVATNGVPGTMATAGLEKRNYLGRSNFRVVYPGDADFHGQMDEVRIWKGVRTEEQIRENMFKSLTGNEEGLTGLWNFGDGSANDSTTNAHHGKLMGQAKVVEATLPSASAMIPWSRLVVQVTDAAGAPLQNVDVRAEVNGVEVGRAPSDRQGLTPLTIWTNVPAVDLIASGSNDLGGWQLAVPVTPYTERRIEWKLGRAIHLAGRATTLDGKTPQANLVVELVKPDETSENQPLSGPSATLSPSAGERDGVRGESKTNRALQLDGTNSFVELPSNLLPGARELTFEAWLKWDAFGRNPAAFALGDRSRILVLAIGDFGTEAFGIGSEGAPIYPSFVSPLGPLELHQWRHLAGVVSTNGLRLYLNGMLERTNAYTDRLFANGPAQQAALGPALSAQLDFFRGEMDEVRLWRTVRTPEQIRENMGRRLTGSEEGLVGLWNFDDPANPGRDASPGAHHGKLIGQATVTNVALPVVLFGNITDAAGKPLANASVEVREPGQPDRRIPANATGEYAFTISSTTRCDLFVTTGKLSAYRLGFRPGGEGAQKLDWTLAETQGATGLDSGRRRQEADSRSTESRDVRLPTSAATNFPSGTVITNMLTDETGAFAFPNLKPGAYQLRAHVLGGKTWFDGGRIFHVRPEMPEAEITRIKSLAFPLAPFKKWRLQTIARWPGAARSWALHIHEAPDGAVWFPMLAGVARYDGAELRQFTAEDGLPTPNIRSVLADTNGVVWLGSDLGVIRYHWSAATNSADRAEVFDKVDGQPIGRVEALARTTDGTLWAHSINGLFRFHEGKFEKLEGVTVDENPMHHPMAAGPDGLLWIANHRGLFRVVGTNVSHWTKNEGLPTMLLDAPSVAPDGAVWFQVWDHGIARFDGTTFNFVSTHDGLPSDRVYGSQVDKDGILWLGTQTGLARFDGVSMVVLKREDGLLNNRVDDVRQTADGAVWLATESGIQRLELDGPRIWSLGDGLRSAEVTTVLPARDGSIWAGTPGGGATRLRGNSLETLTAAEGLGGDYVFSLWEDRDGTVWIGGGTGRLDEMFRFSPRFLATHDGQRLSIPTLSASLPTNALGITAMLRDAQGRLWLACPPVGLTRIGAGDPEVFGRSQGLPAISGIFSGRYWTNASVPLALLSRTGGKLWVGTLNAGLAEYDRETFRPVRPPGPWLIDDTILCLLEEPDGGLWMGTGFGGAGRWDGRHFTLITARDARLGGNRVAAIHRDRRGWLWFGTDGGLTCYDGTTWRTFDQRDGLPEGVINALAEDAHGALWLGTSAGLARYQPAKVELRTPTLRALRGAASARTDAIHATQDRELAFEIGVVEFRTRPELRRFRWKAVAGRPSEAELSATSGWSEPSASPRFNWVPQSRGLHTLAVQFMDRDLNRSPLGLATVDVAPLWYANAWIMAPGGGLVMGLFGWAFVARSLVMRRKREAEQLRERMSEQERVAHNALAAKAAALAESNHQLEEARIAADVANTAKSSFLANMSHELRTPLNAILGYSEMLQEEAADLNQPSFTPDLKKIHGAGKHLLGLINDILDLSKVEAGKMTLYLEEFDVAALVAEVGATVQPLIARQGNRLEIICPADIGVMRSDQTKVRQVLFNLLSNSSKFTEGGTITLRVATKLPDVGQGVDRDSRRIEFSISDTGIGMTAEQMGRLFKAFEQADASTTKKYGGTGLGLVLCRRFSQLMGGDVTVSSQPGVGSTFTVVLPMTPPQPGTVDPAAAVATPVPGVANANAPLVLVIDDDRAVHDLMTRFLVREGYRVQTAANGAEGLRLAVELRPAVITLDVMMPGLDGWSVLRRLKEDPATAGIPVVMVTIVDERNLGFSMGAVDYLAKPIDRARLKQMLAQLRASGRLGDVLVVDDGAEVRDLLRRQLSGEGFEVREAVNGREGLDRVREKIPGVILLDLMMPELDGFGFLEQLRSNHAWQDIPVIVVTAKDLTDEDHLRLNRQVTLILEKGGFQPETLLAQIRSSLRGFPANPTSSST